MAGAMEGSSLTSGIRRSLCAVGKRHWPSAGAALVLVVAWLTVGLAIAVAGRGGSETVDPHREVAAPVDAAVSRPALRAVSGTGVQVAAVSLAPLHVLVSPSVRNVIVGMTTTVDIAVQDAQGLFGVDLHLGFDPTIVRVVDMDAGLPGIQIEAGDFPPPDWMQDNTADNVAGTIKYIMTRWDPHLPVTGTGTTARITFEALRGGTSPVTFSYAYLTDHDGNQFPRTVHDGQINVLAWATLVGQVSFQARTPGPAWICPLSVTLSPPGLTTTSYLSNTICDLRGVFTLASVYTGTYDIRVRDLHSLKNVKRNVTLTLGINPTVQFGTLTEGDADVNGTINILDFSLLSSAYGTAPPSPLYDPRTDFNNSGEIEVLDFSLLASNYEKSGETIVP